jgi:hypothetical protein
VPVGGGWFILNLGEMAWETVPGFGIWRGFDPPDADPSQPGIGVHVHVLQPGEANGYYHAEAAQEGFLVLSGESASPSSRAKSGGCASGTICTPRPVPSTSPLEPEMSRA